MNTIDKQKLVQKIKEQLSLEIFNESQDTVPHQTYSLKLSGKREFIDKEIIVSYGGESTGVNNPVKYARDVEFGFNSPRTIYVPAHSYLNKKGMFIRVKAYSMTFKPHAGKRFCKNSIESILEERLDDIIVAALKAMPEVVNVEKK